MSVNTNQLYLGIKIYVDMNQLCLGINNITNTMLGICDYEPTVNR